MVGKRVLLLGLTGVVVEDTERNSICPTSSCSAEVASTTYAPPFATGPVDHVIMDAGIDLETRLDIVPEIFRTSDTTTVHLKDRGSGKEGFTHFARSVLRGLDD